MGDHADDWGRVGGLELGGRQYSERRHGRCRVDGGANDVGNVVELRRCGR